jgi:hypothetical protein
MAKKGINFADAYGMTTIDGRTFFRKRHNHQSGKTKARQDCIKRQMQGKHYGDRKSVQQALAAASRNCK